MKLSLSEPNISDGGEILKNQNPLKLDKPVVILLIIALVFVLAIGIGLGLAIFSPRKNIPVAQPPADNPPAVQPQTPRPVSKLATDSAVLQLKSDIAGFASELDRVDLLEPQLASPNIDLNITINIK